MFGRNSAANTLLWDELADKNRPSWYLDPAVAKQKRDVHQELIRGWIGKCPQGRILKTDLFEDAWGEDAIYSDLFEGGSPTLFATDIAFATGTAAVARSGASIRCFVCDLRHLPIAASTFDLIISTSTLDHFKTKQEFYSALAQLCQALKPGGRLVITLDNPLNPLYWALRLLSGLRASPYVLGYTPKVETLTAELAKYSLEVCDTAWLVHNPRLISTALFLITRALLRDHANRPIQGMLRFFGLQAKLWPRFSSCFYGLVAIKTL